MQREAVSNHHTRVRRAIVVAAGLSLIVAIGTPASAFRPGELTPAQEKTLKQNFAPCLSKIKGPYTQNFCVCQDGAKKPVMAPGGRITSPCGSNARFCAAFRAPWAEALAKERMYIANIFASDLYMWDSFPDHHDLVRGYVLEKFFVETNPDHKLAQLKAYGGLSGAEYEAQASTRFFEQYVALPTFNDYRHYILAYELQKRFFVRDDQGQIQEVRAMASRIYKADPKFKPLRDATHNQISASLLPKLAAYRDQLSAGSTRTQVEALIREIEKLTSLGEDSLKPQLAEIEDATVRAKLTSLLPGEGADAVNAISSVADLMVQSRQAVAAKTVSAADARRLIDLNVTSSLVIQSRGSAFLDTAGPQPVKNYVRLLLALTNASYGVGLLSERERQAAAGTLQSLLATPSIDREQFTLKLKQAERIVEWSQNSALLAFSEVWPPWTFLLPQVAHIGDDILRGSPLLLYGTVARLLDDHVSGKEPIRHEIFGAQTSAEVRALNPGLSVGRLLVNPAEGSYSRNDIVALPETPTELQPAAGIVTQGEGNVVSHVQLLARSLGIPNVVVGPDVYRQIVSHDGDDVFFLATPGGQVYLKKKSSMTPQEQAVYDDYNRNAERTSDGSLGAGANKLHIDRERLDLNHTAPIDLAKTRRSDSGIRSGPKAAYLGELKHMFPDRVARGVVVPFGAYYAHYQQAKVVVPADLQKAGIAQAGEPLPAFQERTYATFFGEMIPAGKSERELSTWIQPRLRVIQHSIRESPLSPQLKEQIRAEMDRQGLLLPNDKTQTVGCFVRSDTNVEDLDNFNGAGLNLTIFNLASLQDLYDGLQEVWASPFSYRSFSWRQTLIDEPSWVLPSVVILESVPSEKSGVMVTADIEQGNQDKMLVATSEGVGGAVDGTPAETLLWSPEGVELLTLFKSPSRRMLKPGGGSEIVASTGKENVLEPVELDQLTSAGLTIRQKLEPTLDSAGNARAWDIEFGFAKGKLWLFQVRPFVGNEELKNVPALTALETGAKGPGGTLSLEEIVE